MENKKKIGIKTGIASVVIAIAVLAAFSMPASATTNGCPLETKYSGTIDGNIYFETSALKPDGWMQYPILSATFENVPDKSNITVARLYTGVWGTTPGRGGNYTITVNTVDSPKYKYCDPCPGNPPNCDAYLAERCNATNTTECHQYVTGCNVNFISYDIFTDIQTGTNTITVTTEKNASCQDNHGWDGRVYLVALLVVYEDADMPQMTYWIDEGAPYMNNGSGCQGDANEIFNYFNGTVSGATAMKYWTLGFPHVANSPTMTLNTHPIGQPDYKETAAGSYEVFFRWDNLDVNWLEPNNLFYYKEPNAVYERIYSAVLMVQQQLAEKPDLIVTDIEFPTVMRPGKSHTINATVRNEGNTSGAFNVSLYVNGGFKAKEPVTGLDPYKSTTVHFTDVSIADKGCHEFRVMADSDGNIEEMSESNNNRTENYQVGHVIVVKSNSDFEALLTDTYLPTGSVTKDPVDGTYYIQNLTIENCRGGNFVVDAGRGIWIENTNVHFIINNCTVKNCKDHGIDLGHLTNGTVENCVAKDNQLKGIRVANSSYVDIMSNLVQNNSEYGIDIYPEDMPEADCEYITVKNNVVEKENLYGVELIGRNCTICDNLIQNSTGYGIYVYGNHSKIYNNTIRYSSDYGIKMDNNTEHPCLWNSIYGNTLISNNIDHPEYTSQGYDNGDNYWNSTEKLGYYIEGCPCALYNYIGNNWSDYDGVDANHDKIGDTPYDIDGAAGEKDHSPLMEPWVNYTQALTPPNNLDINTNQTLAGAGKVRITWDGSADAYDIYVTDNYATGFGDTPTVEDVTTTYWDDTNAYSSPNIYETPVQRYYKVVNANESADAYSEVVGKYDINLAALDVWVSVPHQTRRTDINEVLMYSLWPGTRLEGSNIPVHADKVYAVSSDGSSTSSAILRANGVWSAPVDMQSNQAFHAYTKPGTYQGPQANVTLRLFLYR